MRAPVLERHPILTAVIATAAFLAVILLGGALGGNRDDLSGTIIEGATRAVAIGLFCLAAIWVGWTEHGFNAPRKAAGWAIVAGPFVYLGVVYPLLFTGSIAPNLKVPTVSAAVAAGAFLAGVAEDLVFRGLIFFTMLAAWGRSRAGVWRAAIVSSIFFSLPHVVNLLSGHQPLRVAAQILWAFVLGVAMALFAFLAGSVWPAAILHGVLDAIVHTNRIGKNIQLSPARAAILVVASIPVLIYAAVLFRRSQARAEPR